MSDSEINQEYLVKVDVIGFIVKRIKFPNINAVIDKIKTILRFE